MASSAPSCLARLRRAVGRSNKSGGALAITSEVPCILLVHRVQHDLWSHAGWLRPAACRKKGSTVSHRSNGDWLFALQQQRRAAHCRSALAVGSQDALALCSPCTSTSTAMFTHSHGAPAGSIRRSPKQGGEPPARSASGAAPLVSFHQRSRCRFWCASCAHRARVLSVELSSCWVPLPMGSVHVWSQKPPLSGTCCCCKGPSCGHC